MDGSGPIGILGLSYKPDTGVVEESQGVALAARLLDEGYRVIGYDPKALPAAQARLGNRLIEATTADACVREAKTVVVMTAWQEFRTIPPGAFQRASTPMTVIDCWRVLPAEIATVANVIYLGRGNRVETAVV
jgi:UDPglucose 6-dehydrogenase